MNKSIFLCLLIFTFIVVGCGPSSSITRVGSDTFAPLSESVNVLVFSKETEIQKPFVTVGIISYTHPGKYRILTIDDAIPELKSKARSVGANGIIIDESIPIKSGMISTGISVKARAIRITESSSQH